MRNSYAQSDFWVHMFIQAVTDCISCLKQKTIYNKTFPILGLLGPQANSSSQKGTTLPINMGDLVISKDATLNEFKLQIQTLPVISEVSF